MANGEEIIGYKENIIRRLINDKDVCQLILDETISDMDDGDMQFRVMQFIRKYWFIPYAQEKESTYITFDMGGTSSGEGDQHKTTVLGVFLFTHNNLMQLKLDPYKEGTRVDNLNIAIQKILNGNYDFGLGKMKLITDNPKQINSVYYGRELIFKVADWSNNDKYTDIQ